MNFGVDDKVCFVYNAEIIYGKAVYIEPFGKVQVRADKGGLYRVPLRQIFLVWKGRAFGPVEFDSLAWSLHNVGLRDLKTKARLMLEGLTGYGIFCFCAELQEAIENGIFNKEPHSQMIAENFLDWANHGFQGGVA